MKVYICSKCLFCFERTGEVETCPDCGAASVRFATDEESAEYRKNREESGRGREESAKNQARTRRRFSLCGI